MKKVSISTVIILFLACAIGPTVAIVRLDGGIDRQPTTDIRVFMASTLDLANWWGTANRHKP